MTTNYAYYKSYMPLAMLERPFTAVTKKGSFDGQGSVLSPISHNSCTLLPGEVSFFHLIIRKRVVFEQLKSLMVQTEAIVIAIVLMISLSIAIEAPLLWWHLGICCFLVSSE